MSAAARVARAIRGAARLPRDERRRALHALGVLALVELGLRLLPLRTVARLAGVRLVSSGKGDAPPRREAVREADVRAVDRAIRSWPFRARCLQRSLVLGHLWRSEHPILAIGVALEADAVDAHAWIEIGGVAIAGDEAGFVALRRARASR